MLELFTSYLIGVLLIALSCVLFRLKTKGLFRLLCNSALGALLLICCNLFDIAWLAVNPLNALVAGFLGIFGLICIFVITTYL